MNLLPRLRVLSLLAPLAFLGLGAAWVEACGPDFLQLLPRRPAELREPIPLVLSEELQAIDLPSPLDAATRKQLAADAAQQVNGHYETPPMSRERQLNAQHQGLAPAAITAFDAARQAADGDAAEAGAATLPAAWRLYAAAASDVGAQRTDAARRRFERLLALPAKEAQPMAVWAAYSLGRLLRQSDKAAAAQAFASARRWRAQGAPDPLGLAVDSLGEEAALHLGAEAGDSEVELVAALQLYLEQARLGSNSGMESLVQLQRTHLDGQPERLRRLLALDWGQALLVRMVADQSFWVDEGDARRRYLQLVEIIDATPGLLVNESWRWGALAWQNGDLTHARKWVNSSRTGLGLWTQAKIALADGKADAAAQAFSEAVKLWPAKGGNLVQRNRLRAEQGLLQLQRGELALGLRALMAAGERYELDTAFVAERLLTSAELRTVIDDVAPAGTADKGLQKWRHLLARRLMREGQFAEAQAYFPTRYELVRWTDKGQQTETLDLAALAHDYAAALDRAERAWTRVGAATALMQAGHLARERGMELMGFELAPDAFATDGNFDLGDMLDAQAIGGPQSAVETQRLAQVKPTRALLTGESQPKSLPRFHYRHVAAQHAWDAAQALPERSQAYASSLCHAALWVGVRDEALGRQVWERYVSRGAYLPWASRFGHECEEPDFAGARRLQAENALRGALPWLFHHPRRSAAAAVLIVGALLAWGVWARRRTLPPA